MQAGELWLSIVLGAGLGLAYVAASFVSNRRAQRSKERFMIIVVATMLIRILLAMIALLGIMLLLPVSPTAFLGSFFVVFVIGLIFEVWLLHQKASPQNGTRP